MGFGGQTNQNSAVFKPPKSGELLQGTDGKFAAGWYTLPLQQRGAPCAPAPHGGESGVDRQRYGWYGQSVVAMDLAAMSTEILLAFSTFS